VKRWLVISLFICQLLTSIAQEQPVSSNTEQQLENLTDLEQSETEDDNFLQQLSQFRKNPLPLNSVTADDLKELRMLSDLQITHFIIYRNLFGKFLSVYELQAIPSWDLFTIRKILPFVTVQHVVNTRTIFAERFKNGQHSILARYAQVPEKAKGFEMDTTGAKYLGGRDRFFFRYRYQYKNLLQYGITGDKDAGEQFFKGAQKQGFDFYSFHLFARNAGAVKSLAIGDYTVNMGQGLILWQSLAFRKSVDVINIKRQSPVLRPYNSAGEFNFHRGAAVTLSKKKLEITVFGSWRKLTANSIKDTSLNEEYVSSVSNSGYHRTASEVADRNLLRQTSFGGNFSYKETNGHIGLNAAAYRFSLPLQKSEQPYNLYEIKGNQWANFSIDYSYTFRNFHFFGEAAADKNLNKAFLNGVLVSMGAQADLSLLYRNISPNYQSVAGNAFTENTYPGNENGVYAGLSIRPSAQWKVDAYADFFRFRWLKYQVDAPSAGTDYLLQLTYMPGRQTEIYMRFRNEDKESNQPDNTSVTNQVVRRPRQSWRIQSGFAVSKNVTLRSRAELLWFDKNGNNPEAGFLTFMDVTYSSVSKPWLANARLQYFETDGYDSRIYAYERDVQYYFSIPSFFDKGLRYYLNFHWNISSGVSFWLKWAQTVYRDKQSIGSGLDEIAGNKRSEIRVQINAIF